jgi:hypothetical protein
MYYREEYLARLLWESGCEVVADMSYGHRPAAILDGLNATRKVTTLVSGPQFAYLDPVAGTSLKTVLGSIYESWAPLYGALFERLHRGQFDTSRPLELDLNTTDQTPLGVQVNPSFPNYLQFDALSDDYGRALAGRQNPGPQLAVFQGPYQTNGQRDANGDGIADAAAQQLVADHAVLTDAEVAGMCFFVSGVVEKSILNVPTSPDVAALVPGGLLPGATAAETKVALHPTSEDQLALPAANSSPVRLSADCRKNAQWIYRSNG